MTPLVSASCRRSRANQRFERHPLYVRRDGKRRWPQRHDLLWYLGRQCRQPFEYPQAWDTVNGSNNTVDLSNAQAVGNGNGDTIAFLGAACSTVSAAGTSEKFVFQPLFGHASIARFDATDSVSLSASSFGATGRACKAIWRKWVRTPSSRSMQITASRLRASPRAVCNPHNSILRKRSRANR
jgi:hypothetical protein